MINPKDLENGVELDDIDPEVLAELEDGRDPEEINKKGEQ